MKNEKSCASLCASIMKILLNVTSTHSRRQVASHDVVMFGQVRVVAACWIAEMSSRSCSTNRFLIDVGATYQSTGSNGSRHRHLHWAENFSKESCHDDVV